MTIRRATFDDATSLSALALEVWLHTYCRDGIPPIFANFAFEAFGIAAMQRLIANPEERVFLDYDDYAGQQAMRGYVVWRRAAKPPVDECPECEIITLYVRERHKGMGIGSALLNAAYANMKEAGLNSAFLTVNAENEQAIAFYQRKGWHQIGTCDFEIDGNAYPNLVLQKDF